MIDDAKGKTEQQKDTMRLTIATAIDTAQACAGRWVSEDILGLHLCIDDNEMDEMRRVFGDKLKLGYLRNVAIAKLAPHFEVATGLSVIQAIALQRAYSHHPVATIDVLYRAMRNNDLCSLDFIIFDFRK